MEQRQAQVPCGYRGLSGRQSEKETAMDTQYFRTFISVLQTKSFSKTATSLNVTQSAVSHRVKYLEDHFNCRLIDRSGAELFATEAGQRLLKKAEQIVRLEDELEKELSKSELGRKFSIGSTVAFGINQLPRIMNEFFLAHSSGVDLKILIQTPRQLLEGLRNDSYDIAVLEHNDGLDFAGLKIFDLPQDELVFISNKKAWLDEQNSPLSWLLENCIITRLEGCSCRDVLTENLKKCSLELKDFRSSVVCDDLRMTIDTVLAGGGIAFVSRALVRDQIEKELLYEYKIDGFQHRRNVTVVFKPGKSADDNVQFFLNALVDQ